MMLKKYYIEKVIFYGSHKTLGLLMKERGIILKACRIKKGVEYHESECRKKSGTNQET